MTKGFEENDILKRRAWFLNFHCCVFITIGLTYRGLKGKPLTTMGQ